MRQRTLGGETFATERRTCEWGAVCANRATHAARVGATEIVACAECVDGHDLTDVRELRPSERFTAEEYASDAGLDAREAGWSP